MDMEKIVPIRGDPKEQLANERTFLAWIRTSIGIMAFGFVVEKFALFLKQIGYLLGNQTVSVPHQGTSTIFGMFLVGIGALIGLASYFEFRKVRKQLAQGRYQPSAFMPIATTALVVFMGLFLVIYLLNT